MKSKGRKRERNTKRKSDGERETDEERNRKLSIQFLFWFLKEEKRKKLIFAGKKFNEALWL